MMAAMHATTATTNAAKVAMSPPSSDALLLITPLTTHAAIEDRAHPHQGRVIGAISMAVMLANVGSYIEWRLTGARSKRTTIISTISRPISSEAVAAGEGTLHT